MLNFELIKKAEINSEFYPFFKVKDSTLSSIKYTFSSNGNKYLYKQINRKENNSYNACAYIWSYLKNRKD